MVCLLVAPPASAQEFGDAGVDAGDVDGGELDGGVSEHCPDGVVGCSASDVDWHSENSLFDSVDWDTGWVPAGSPIQLRFGLVIAGETMVDLGGTVVGSWPPAIAVGVHGRPGAGLLTMNYGFELIAMLRFDVEVAGIRYDWEGDIPIPFIPEDLRLAGEAVFDPFLLPGVEERPVVIADETDPVRVLWYDALSSIIPIPGVGGGFLVAAQAELETSYQTERIEVEGGLPIVGEDELTRLDPPSVEDPDAEGGYGAELEVTAHPVGSLSYDGRVLIIPELYLEVVGTRFDYPLAEIPINLVDLEEEVIFDDETVELPLPDVDVQPARLDLGWGYLEAVTSQPLVLLNNGNAPLVVEAVTETGPFTMEPAYTVLDPHSTERVSIRFRPEIEGLQSVMFELATNDPDEPSILVLLEGEGRARPLPEPDPVDADVEEADAGFDADFDADGFDDHVSAGCGCRTAATSGAAGAQWLALFALLFVVRTLRRRT